MSRIFWDTNLFIYLFEGVEPFSAQVASLRAKMLRRGDQLLTSTLTLGEILVKPTRERNTKLLYEYQTTIPAVATMLTFDEKAATVYASLRCDPGIRPPDAIQLACAGAFGVDLFITNDARLHGKVVSGIQFVVPMDRVPI